MYTSFPVPALNIKSLYTLGLLLITSFSHVQAQGEWKKNSKGRDVYVYKPSSNTPVKVTTKPLPTYRKEESGRPVKETVETNVDYKLYYDKELDDNDMRIARQAGKWGLLNTKGWYSVPLIYDSILPAGTSKLYPAKQNGKWGFITHYGYQQVPMIYDAIIKPFVNIGDYATVLKDGRQFEINASGRPAGELASDYAQMEPFSEGLARVLNGFYGFIDKKGTVIIPLQYDYASNFKEGLAFVKKGLYVGFIDKTGKIIIPLEYFDGVSFSEGLTALNKNGKWGYLDTKGNIKIPFKYEEANSFKDGKAFVMQNGERFQIDKAGNRIGKIPLKYDIKEPIREGLIKVMKGGLYGFINNKDSIIIPLQYLWASDFKEELSLVQKIKFGFIDKTGKEIISFIYDGGNNFYEGWAVMKKDHYWGFIDKKGNTVIEFKYDNILKGFTNGIAEVKLNGEIIKINKSGEKVNQ